MDVFRVSNFLRRPLTRSSPLWWRRVWRKRSYLSALKINKHYGPYSGCLSSASVRQAYSSTVQSGLPTSDSLRRRKHAVRRQFVPGFFFNLANDSVDSLNQLCQIAPNSTFDGTLIPDMSFETFGLRTGNLQPVSGTCVDKGTFSLEHNAY
jgi:hypothetical protein